MMTTEQLMEEAMKLSDDERRILANAIESSLPLTEEEWAAAWMPELERRRRALEDGRTMTIPFDPSKESINQLIARAAELRAREAP